MKKAGLLMRRLISFQTWQGYISRMVSVVIFFRIFEINFCFVVDICDLVHNGEVIFHLP